MSRLFQMHYRITRDWFDSRCWVVQQRSALWPFWRETAGLLNSKEDALELIEIIQQEYRS